MSKYTNKRKTGSTAKQIKDKYTYIQNGALHWACYPHGAQGSSRVQQTQKMGLKDHQCLPGSTQQGGATKFEALHWYEDLRKQARVIGAQTLPALWPIVLHQSTGLEDPLALKKGTILCTGCARNTRGAVDQVCMIDGDKGGSARELID